MNKKQTWISIMSAIAISSVIEAYTSSSPTYAKYTNQAKEMKA